MNGSATERDPAVLQGREIGRAEPKRTIADWLRAWGWVLSVIVVPIGLWWLDGAAERRDALLDAKFENVKTEFKVISSKIDALDGRIDEIGGRLGRIEGRIMRLEDKRMTRNEPLELTAVGD